MSSSTTALSGIASGLDTTSIINSLMAAAAQPQVLLQTQIATASNKVSSLQSLNALFAKLASDTDRFTGSSASLAAFTASTGDSAVATASADPTATAGSITFTVDQIASAQTTVTGAMASWAGTPSLTITDSAGNATTVTAVSNSISDVVYAINHSDAGVTAQQVRAGTDGSGNPLYRIQFSSNETGAAAGFTVADSSGQDLVASGQATTVSTAQDAQLTLWAGTSAAQTVTSSSNTFSEVMPGVTLTAVSASTATQTVVISQDVDTEASTANSLVAAIQNILSAIDSGTKTTTTTDANDGGTDVVFGPFTADSNIRDARQQLSDALTGAVNGISPSQFGIVLNKDGTVTFDKDAFTTAMTSDPRGTADMFNQIVARVNSVASAVSDPLDGSITSEINNQNDDIDAMQQKSDDMTTMLNQQQATLQQQFAYMETMMSQIQSQGSYLQSYFDSQSSSSSKK